MTPKTTTANKLSSPMTSNVVMLSPPHLCGLGGLAVPLLLIAILAYLQAECQPLFLRSFENLRDVPYAVWGWDILRASGKRKIPDACASGILHGDPYGNRTHVTAVKGRCLNRLTNGPGSGNLIRTDDIPGMNRLLYQLSYAAMWSTQFRHRRNQLYQYSLRFSVCQEFFCFFHDFFGDTFP